MSPHERSLQDFIINKNIEAYRRRLAGTLDSSERELLLRLLKEEEAKLPPARQGQSLRR